MMMAMLLAMIQPVETPTVSRERQTLSLPREIAPAVVPYLKCMLEDRTARIAGSRTGEAARAGIEQLKADCRSERDVAQARARQMLKASTVPEADREKLIETSLSSIDHSQDHIALRLDRANPSSNEASD